MCRRQGLCPGTLHHNWGEGLVFCSVLQSLTCYNLL